MLLALPVFVGVLDAGLVYDDATVVQRVEAIGSFRSLIGSGRGLHYALLRLESMLHGGSTAGYHATSLVLHAVTAGVAALLARRLTGRAGLALLCGGLFAVHPVHVEAVAGIANRKDVLATLLVMLAVLARFSSRRPLVGYAASLALLGLGVTAKEVAAVGGVAILFLADLLHPAGQERGAAWRRATLRALPVLLPALALAWWWIGGGGLQLGDLFRSEGIVQRTDTKLDGYGALLATVLANLPEQLRLLFLPWSLSVDPPVHVATGLADPSALAGAGLLAVALAGVVWLGWRRPGLWFGPIWIAALWLPVSNLVPLTKFFVAERYLYGPSFGACLLLAQAADSGWRRAPRGGRNAILLAAVLLLGLASLRCVSYVRAWRSNETLVAAALATFPEGTWRLHLLAGQYALQRGDHAQAAQNFERALAQRPNWLLFQGLVESLARLDRLDQVALVTRRMATVLGDPTASYHAGLVLSRLGQQELAVGHWQDYLRAAPGGAHAAEVRSRLSAVPGGPGPAVPGPPRDR